MSKPRYAPDLMILVPQVARSVHQRLMLSPSGVHSGMLDGAWWPRSGDVVSELPGLIMIIDGVHGVVTRLALAADGWSSHPHLLRLRGRALSIDYFASQPASLLTAFCVGGDRVDLLVVPPETAPDKAHAAMALVARSSNRLTTRHP